MTTATLTDKKSPARTVALLAKNCGCCVLRITQGRRSTAYTCTPLPNDFGPAYTVENRSNGERYAVCLGGAGYPSCECPGFHRWGHCKHLESLVALRNAGKL